jgi:hypothetical protein
MKMEDERVVQARELVKRIIGGDTPQHFVRFLHEEWLRENAARKARRAKRKKLLRKKR